MKKKAAKYGITYAGVIFACVFAWIPYLADKFTDTQVSYIDAGIGTVIGLLLGYFGLVSNRPVKKARKDMTEEERKSEDDRYMKAMLKKIHRDMSPFIGTEDALKIRELQIDPTGPSEQEIISGTANKTSDGIVYSVRPPHCGHGHSYFLMTENGVSDKLRASCIEGFITSHGRFVGREEAWNIAKEANQIWRVTGSEGELFSEDVWEPKYNA